jgi:hypothetical protein
LEAGGQDATQGDCCAEGLFSAGLGLGQRLVGVAARAGGGTVAKHVIFGAAAADEGHRVVVVEGHDLIAYRLGDRGHLRDPGVELRTDLVLAMKQAAHVLALGHAVGDALAMELLDDMFQPKMNIDGFRAERGTAGAVVLPMVSKWVARRSQGSRWRRRARRRCRTGVALTGHEMLFGGNTEGGDAIRGHKREFRCIFVGFEDRGNNDQEEFAGHFARVVGRGAKFAKTILFQSIIF